MTALDDRAAEVYPILPVAPGTALSLGALSWAGSMGIAFATDPALCRADRFAARLERRLAEVLAASVGAAAEGGPGAETPGPIQRKTRGEEASA